jgi:uncharacterized protein
MRFKSFISPVLLVCLTLPSLAQQVQTDKPHMPAGVTESAVSFPTTDSLTLPGTLTLPPAPPADSKGKPVPRPPIAVLVQGSGVQDRDATVGPNKFFQQLAWGLAERGVATLRYDRRAKVDLNNFMQHADLEHEVVIDAASALAFVQTLPSVDSSRVFLVGHSLGAQLAPDTVALRLSQQPNSVRGMVLLSGVARPTDQVLDEQIRTLGKLQGGTPAQIDQVAKRWTDIWVQARDPNIPADKRIGVGASLPVSYWRDWLRRDPVATMHKLSLPTLVMRGAKDLNATHADFDLLKSAATAPGSDAHEFAGLNHIYMQLEGEPNGTDIMKPGKVAPEFMDYLAAWLLRTGGPKTLATPAHNGTSTR